MRSQKVLFALLSFASTFCFSQLSDLHYLPPMRQGANNQAIQNQVIYLSTPETTSFVVEAFRGSSTIPIATFNISNTLPAQYTLANGDNNITLVDSNNTGIKLTNSGLRFVSAGGENFYVNYRGRSTSQAASLTSKGRAAMGTHFKWGGVPNLGEQVSKSNFLGIMATQNNTTIDLFGYDPNCEFRIGNDPAGITADSYQIVLQANESFVFESYVGNSSTPANVDGWLGASIIADQDIVISNGGLNFGRQAGSSNRDAGIDQPVPENRLGKEYVFVRGNGNANGWTEFPLIIGTVNDTDIFVNGSTTPIATINNGEYFQIPSSNYSSNTVGANMFVRTSQDVYSYQCVGGSTAAYTQGLNFVAPVSCLLPNTMNNITNITDAAGVTISGGVTIIASTNTPDANITVNDGNGIVALPPSSTIAGTTEWKTIYIPNLTGDVSVVSTGPIAVGFFGFNGARGLAGYFSGFDTIPDINLQITGNICLPGAVLEIANSESFDAYQWYENGNMIPGATSSVYTATVAGNYFLRVTRGPCSYDSNIILVFNCNPDIVLNKDVNLNTVTDGELVTFTITVESLGYDPVSNLVITDLLPNGLEFISASIPIGTFTYPNWDIGTMTRGQLYSMTLTAKAGISNIYLPTNTHTNTVFNAQDQIDSNTTLDSPSVVINVNMISPTTVITNRRITVRVNKN